MGMLCLAKPSVNSEFQALFTLESNKSLPIPKLKLSFSCPVIRFLERRDGEAAKPKSSSTQVDLGVLRAGHFAGRYLERGPIQPVSRRLDSRIGGPQRQASRRVPRGPGRCTNRLAGAIRELRLYVAPPGFAIKRRRGWRFCTLREPRGHAVRRNLRQSSGSISRPVLSDSGRVL